MNTLVALGEALWDVFPDAKRPGGSPCNVAFHAAQLGSDGVIVTRLGTDADGDALLAYLDEHGVNTAYIQRDDAHPTGTVTVEIEDGEPSYIIHQGVAWDALAWHDDLADLARRADALCYGTLGQRHATARTTILRILDAPGPGTRRVFDVHLRPPFDRADLLEPSLRRADVVKMSESEQAAVGRLFGHGDVAAWLLNDLGVEMVVLTKGAAGAEVITKATRVERPGESVDTSQGDAVGAGDSFLAAFTHGLIHTMPVGDALALANRYAAHVATRRGAMPVFSAAELRALRA